ncbi:MAG: mitochondrial fission ELM1 family protein [Caulobacteraceae bacterium]
MSRSLGDRPLSIWAVSDGRAGIEAQALGLADAVARLQPAAITVKRIAWPGWMRRVPSPLILTPRRLLADGSDPIAAPWPDLWIANGRAAIPLSIGVRRWSEGRSFVVQLQDPLRSSRRFDLIVPPNHDGLIGPNVFPITGTPHRVTPERLARELEPFRARFDALPRPHVAVLIGGRSRAFDLSAARAGRLADQIAEAVRVSGGSLLLTFSRRTPEDAKAIMSERLRDLPGWLWDGEGANPYFAFLATADHVLVTEDSANMPTEAGATGKPVHLLPMDGKQARKQRFHAELARLGVARPFSGKLEHWNYAPLRETDRAAAEVLKRMARKA